VYTRYLGLRDACRLLGLDWPGFRRHLQATVARWPERDFAGRCRRFDRLRDLGTVHAGEDRHRWYFWTVTPMWANAVLDFAYRRIGSRLSNVAFFVEMLRAVYPKVLEVPLHRRPFKLASRLDTLARSLHIDFLTRVRQHRWARWLRVRLGYREKWAEVPSREERDWVRHQVEAAFRESAAVRSVFTESFALGYLETQQAAHRLYQLLTAVWFVAELDRHFPDLFSGPWGA
jgi:hypothetical protein